MLHEFIFLFLSSELMLFCFLQLLVLLCGRVCESTDACDRRQPGASYPPGFGWPEGLCPSPNEVFITKPEQVVLLSNPKCENRLLTGVKA